LALHRTKKNKSRGFSILLGKNGTIFNGSDILHPWPGLLKGLQEKQIVGVLRVIRLTDYV
jgi:hypothetical protein